MVLVVWCVTDVRTVYVGAGTGDSAVVLDISVVEASVNHGTSARLNIWAVMADEVAVVVEDTGRLAVSKNSDFVRAYCSDSGGAWSDSCDVDDS